MQRNDEHKEQQRLQKKVSTSESYVQLVKMEAGQDLFGWLNQQQTFLFNELLKEQEHRAQKLTTDVIRGRLQMISLLSNHVNNVYVQGQSALNKLSKS